MFQIEIKINSIEQEDLQKATLLLKLARIEFAYLHSNQNKGSWIVGFNCEESHQKSIQILKNDNNIKILDENKFEDNNDYEIIYDKYGNIKFSYLSINQEDQQINKNNIKKIEINTNEQEQQGKLNKQEALQSVDSVQNISFSSQNSKEDEQIDGDSLKEKELDDNQNQDQKNAQIGSSNTIESILSNEYLKDDGQVFGDSLEATVIQSPLISEEETDDSHQKLYQNIANINTTKEQKNALYLSFKQSSESIKQIKKRWVEDEESKKQDLFNANVLYNPKYQILALGLFTFYMLFL